MTAGTAPTPATMSLVQRALRMLDNGSSPSQVCFALEVDGDWLDKVITARSVARKGPGAAGAFGAATLVPLSRLAAHPENIRDDVGDVTELAASIEAQGILQPLVVIPGDGGQYFIVAGHRRLAAARVAGLVSVPVVVRRDITGDQVLAAMLTENLQRANLNPIEEAKAFRKLTERGWSQTRIGAAIGKTDFHVSRRLDLLFLTAKEQQLVITKELTLARAHEIAAGRRPGKANAGVKRPKPFHVPHFNRHHPLARVAGDMCAKRDHAITLKLGVACGECWEHAIRADDRFRTPPVCAECGCTDENACPGGCEWVNDELCTRCVDKPIVDVVLTGDAL
jgi:ParB/RepB/Spo0J family partition protein